ncbi:MAG: hypothetical protein HN396_00100 [Gemmatimonadales bacterium]|nr:hypothetical protein [Gemmatimonadales bacterium]MDG2240058.1 hypothetical protein [Longimicrobiales bacterium]NCG32222.1 hypothetical protein [Pseudomonadota bacterium]MBT3497982.1 hypothetical protein [Gemmatimonadales bacterium]MBT3775361.1 hypothetical protein [Gemmatimonadales bacterium]
MSRTLSIVFASVALLLLVSALNAGNLFLARAERRKKELSIRSALGGERRIGRRL